MYVMYGTFVRPGTIGGCLAIAEEALAAQGLQVLKGADGVDYLVVGGSGDVTLTIVGVPQPGGVWMVVSASSTDSGLAAQARDLIRGMIESAPIA